MTVVPDFEITIVHIEGPLKGEIQEFRSPEIFIGRNLDCQVRFPADCVTISRDHARIVRDGNRFKVINKSANYTYLNGKPVKEDEEAYLKSGDWLMFAEGGPKVSFLAKVADTVKPEAFPAEASRAPEEKARESNRRENSAAYRPNAQRPPEPVHSENSQPSKPSSAPSSMQNVPLIIRYGPTLQRFKSLPVTIGKSAECDFTIDHAALSGRHAEIFFKEGRYWVKDLTGAQTVFLDGRTIDPEAPLQPENKLDLTHQGPSFRFLGDGRLDELGE
ncbi:MAG: FHA domain-containing protein [Desulfosalsimonadaceae bacterium]